MKHKLIGRLIYTTFLFALILLSFNCGEKSDKTAGKTVTLLNVSYDPTREMYQEFNASFAKYWQNKTGDSVVINQSHGGSGKQARSVIDGLEADVVTLALAYDIDAISEKGKSLAPDWQKRFPNNSAPYTSTIVFVVRKGNPKQIKDWDDLTKNNVSVITPNPKTSGGARWNYLAAWAFALEKFGGDEVKVKEFMKKLFKNVPVLDSGARGSTNTFVQRNIGDVFISWENEAKLVLDSFGKDQYEIVYPSISILAEPPVTYIDKFAEKHKTTEVAKAYLEYLYTPQGQEIVAKHFFRPTNAEILSKYSNQFPQVKLFSIDEKFGGWKNAQATHFGDGGTFDEIYLNAK
jgi:sulfate transport system substrate-binding protein